MKKSIAIIGAGPAGIMAALRAVQRGHNVVLIEKKATIANKLRISGKGRCNITNNTDIEGILENIPGNPNFLYSSLYTFSNYDIIDFFETRGLKTKVERGDRIFPVSDDAKDVVDVLLKELQKNNIKIMLNTHITDIKQEDKFIILIKDQPKIIADSLIIATGGLSYPKTGSTGDGYRFAAKFGHKITDLKPSLVPLICKEEWIKELQGLSLKNIAVTFIDKDTAKKIYTDFGEMIFTHFGVSGPVILSASRHIVYKDFKGVNLLIDLKPALDEKKLDERIQRDFNKFSNKQFKNSLDELLPQKMIPVVIKLSKISEEKTVHQITKEERKKLVNLLKNLEVTIVGSRSIDEAIVTIGGVDVSEINPSTMESKIVKGLYFAGEIIDVDGYTGGFNLTIAFSTGYMAGDNC